MAQRDVGNVRLGTDARSTWYQYDEVGRVTQVLRPDGSTVGFTYDLSGNMKVLTTPSAVDHRFDYNAINLNDEYAPPISPEYQYVYDDARRLTQVVFPSGQDIDYVYADGRLIRVETPEGNVVMAYKSGTNLVESVTMGTESITYAYDGSLLTSETRAGTLAQTLSYGYNDDFAVDEFTYAGASESYTYDNDGLLTTVGAFTIPRDATTGFPTSVSDGTFTATPAFNGYGELDGVDYTIGASDAFEWEVVRYNTGAIQSKVETLGATTDTYAYTYDELGQLRTVTKNSSLVEEYQYDANGWRTYEMNTQRGITGRVFDYSDEDHLVSVTDSGDVTTYSYDQDGFLVSTNDTGNSESTLYDYSSRGELRSVTFKEGDEITSVVEYVHDPLGRRIAKKVDGDITEKYLWSGMTQLLAVYDGSDVLKARFECASGRMPAKMVVGAATYYLCYDQVGSLRAVYDETGALAHQIQYDSFGNILSESASGLPIPFGFAGGLHDRDTNLVRFGFRDYDPETGRWTAKDPIGFAGGDTNQYGYCGNDPVSLIDPTGELAFLPGLIGRAVGGVSSYISAVRAGEDTMGALRSAAVGAAAGAVGAYTGAFWTGMIAGAANVGLQLWNNGGNLQKIDVVSAAISGVSGAVGGFVSGRIATRLAGTRLQWKPRPGAPNGGWFDRLRNTASSLALGVGQGVGGAVGGGLDLGGHEARQGVGG